jgi:hypothetical protein
MKIKLSHVVSDTEYTSSIKKKLTQFINRSGESCGSLHIVKHKGWNARAFYDGEFYEDSQEEALATVLQEYGYTSFFMVPFCEDLLDETMTSDVVWFPATPDGIEELRVYSFFDWHILCGGQPDWLILLTPVDDFMIVMGKDKIFDAICSNFPSSVWLRIEEMADFAESYSNLRFIYTNLISNLNDAYSSATPGEIMNIDLVRIKE